MMKIVFKLLLSSVLIAAIFADEFESRTKGANYDGYVILSKDFSIEFGNYSCASVCRDALLCTFVRLHSSCVLITKIRLKILAFKVMRIRIYST